MSVKRQDALVEIVTGLCHEGRAPIEKLLSLSRGLPVGGLVLENGVYLLREVVPLEPWTVDAVANVVARSVRAAEAVWRMTRAAAPKTVDVFVNYAQ